ncbi:MAG: imidazole glycerol phosphate synthase subunit HisH [Firmicutes bacterium]|nr:imidazole glycerol phosphate synthase subunit HisH [Bacillota bacterium]
MIAIVDYGMGNLRSVQKGLEKVGFQAAIVATPKELEQARGIVLPGVGAFGDAMENLRAQGLDRALREAVVQGKPLLGICLGLQLFFSFSEEGGWHEGLDLIPGRVRRLPGRVKVPHMGWNQVELKQANPLFTGIPDRSYFYFVHSYYVDPAPQDVISGVTAYGIAFTSMVARGNLFGVQFHPEKSSRLGLEVLANFGRLVAAC